VSIANARVALLICGSFCLHIVRGGDHDNAGNVAQFAKSIGNVLEEGLALPHE
jgi:hypothetical protein